MISSVNNNLNQLTSELVAAKQTTKISTDSEGKEKVDNSLLEAEVAPKTDTLEISPEGLAAAYAQTSTETDSSSTTTDLSSYTEDELDSLVDDGSITEMEKNAELASRAMEESLEKNQDKMLAQLDETKEGSGPPPPKPEDEAREGLPPVGNDLALTEGAATEDEE